MEEKEAQCNTIFSLHQPLKQYKTQLKMSALFLCFLLLHFHMWSGMIFFAHEVYTVIKRGKLGLKYVSREVDVQVHVSGEGLGTRIYRKNGLLR